MICDSYFFFLIKDFKAKTSPVAVSATVQYGRLLAVHDVRGRSGST